MFSCYEKMNDTIAAEKFIKILYNVRKFEYYENPELYPFSKDDFCKTVIYSGWEFNNPNINNYL